METTTRKLLESSRIEKLAALFLLIISVFVAFLAVGAIRDAFSPRPPMGNIISVEGVGKVNAVPDIARISFSVTEEAESVSDAQTASTKKVDDALAALDDLNVEEKDIKTTSYSVYPKYSRAQPCYEGFCPDYEQTIVGYTVSQTIEIKVRDTAQVGEVLARLGDASVSNLSGPSFTVDDPEELKAEARAAAIENAREKAKALAKDLGVSLVRVTGFWENVGYYPYESKAYGLGGDGVAVPSSAPSVPVGEEEISISVSVSYEIR
jgi:hypothetical protein